ncbi:MAG TPA: hypothetical protein QF604_08185 [Candidatus Latescibacteria bacterium]|nr:hypothetical protein [Candidatus Latescibacterota bacterium]HCV24412.1 hypothetical protein [Candidatus Latescibacterota bacterium]HJN27882.1 hypothetical protein [Candidatus Latescibacterota bacterium]
MRRGKVQVVQVGNFGVDFYGLADDPDVARQFPGMPAVGIEENLELAADLIPQIQEAGARVVGQFSMCWHNADHEKGKGLFGSWDRIWTPELLGESPADSAMAANSLDASGEQYRRHIEGLPYFVYSGCISNPVWLQTLKAMVRKGIDLGLDGFNATHNFEGFCGCGYCADTIRAHMRPVFDAADLDRPFDGDYDGASDAREPATGAPGELKHRDLAILEQAAAHRRKNAFDDVLIDYGRSLRPDLLAAHWYYEYGMRVNDERAGLPADLWGSGEDYIWYSQGPHRWGSSIEQSYIADMGLNARHMHAAGDGRPFVINKYDYRRWRVWAAEAAAHGGRARRLFRPHLRYQRFVADHEDLLHPATPVSHVGLVYPRRAERLGEEDYLGALKWIAEWLEDAHVLYDLLFDDQLTERANDFPTLILPDIRRLADAEIAAVKRHVDAGGAVVVAGSTGTMDAEGGKRAQDPLFTKSAGSVFCWQSMDWQPETTVISTLPGEPEMPVYPHLSDSREGQATHYQAGRSVRRFLAANRRALVGLRPCLAN